MPSRSELNLRARAVGIDQSTFPNDSALEQEVLYVEKNAGTVTGALATGTLTSDATAPANNETVVVGSRTYTFKTALSSPVAANEVLIGANAAAALANLKKAINDSGTQGTEYSKGTKVNPDVSAGTLTATTLVLDAKRKQIGNALATTETSDHLSFGGATLASGLPGVVANPSGSAEGVSGQYRYDR